MKKVIGHRSTVQRSVATCNLAPAMVSLATDNLELYLRKEGDSP